jgi:hypothetical protein
VIPLDAKFGEGITRARDRTMRKPGRYS